MKKLYFVIAIVVCKFFFSQTTSFHDTQGNIEVNGGGQLQYTLPIALPPGIKSVAPQVNLIYTSGSGNGIAGYGWNLSAVTSIHRIGKTIEKDGELQSVKLDYSDYYSFNGQRLILKSGEYGKDGTEYVTEKYSNIKIKSVGRALNIMQPLDAPNYFEVTFEDGSQAWYGGWEGNDPFYYPGRTMLEYNIIKWKDAQGNVINYDYDQISNVSVIKTISWGGNETLNKPNFNEITFNYADRDLDEISYVKGVSFIQSKILNEIVVKSNGVQFKRYAIKNDFKNGTNYQFVQSIKEYSSKEPGSPEEPANPVVFEYPAPTPSSMESVYTSNSDPFSGIKFTGDFNGDSYLDFIMSNGTIKLGAFNDNFTTINTNKNFNNTALIVNSLIDEEGQIYNGNGIVQYEKGKIEGYIFRDNIFVKVFDKLVYDTSDCILTAGGGSLGCHISATLNEGDIDGDGISNAFLSLTRYDRVCIGNVKTEEGKGTIPDCDFEDIITDIGDFVIDLKNQNLPYATYTTDAAPYYGSFENKYLDVDGDGKVDVLRMTNTAYTVFEFVKTSANQYLKKVKFTSNLVETKDPEFPILYGDFNGDGKLDFIIPITENTIGKLDDWRLYIGTGVGFTNYVKKEFFAYRKRETEQNSNYIFYAKQFFYSVADINKDGKSDIVSVFSYNQLNQMNDSYRKYGYVVTSKLGNGSQVNQTIDFTPGLAYQSPQYTVAGSDDTTLFVPLTNPIKANNNYYDIFLYWKQTLHKIKSPTSLSELARIKSIFQNNLNTSISYLELNPDVNPNFYKKEKKEYYPYFSLKRADQTFTVSQLNQGGRKQDFRYRGMTAHLQGKGMMGFLQVARSSFYVDGMENTKIWSGSETDPQKFGVPVKEWSIKTNNENQIFPADISVNNTQLLTFKQTQYTVQQLANGVDIILPNEVTEKDFLKNVTSKSTITYGDYYLPNFTEINVENGFARKTTEMHYMHNPGGIGKDYFIGRPDWKEDINYAYNDSKKSKETYAYKNNLLETLTKYDNINSNFIREKYIYDEANQTGFGNITQKTITTQNKLEGFVSTKLQYEPQGRFVIKTTDNLGLETNMTYNNWGQILTQIDPLNNSITNVYDNWGKLLSSNSNLAGTTTYGYDRFSIYGVIGKKVTEIVPSGEIIINFTDNLNQKIKTITKAFNQGNYIVKDFAYDAIGRKYGESEPYITNDSSGNYLYINPSNWNLYTYDDTVFPAKMTVQAFNNGKKMETSISGRITTIIEKKGYLRTYTKTTDAIGNLISSTDPGGTIDYTYNAAGQQTKAQYAENAVTTAYDNWGRKSEFNDPANGKYEYEYTGFGEIKTETSPKGYKEYSYKLNRQLNKIIEQSNVGTSTNKNYSFTYNQYGQISLKTGTSNGKSFTISYSYRPDGRLGWTTEYLEGKQFYKWDIQYDQFGRVKRYDQGLVSNGVTTAVAVENKYSTWDGSLYQLKQENTPKILWELQSANAKGQVLNAKLGAAQITNLYDDFGFSDTTKHISTAANLLDAKYVFDALKNELKERHHYNFGIDESFDYDTNNRLINWTDPVTGIKPINDRNAYDIKGRITANDQLGNISYTIGGNIYRASKMNLNANGLANYGIGGQNILLQNITYNENNDPVKISGRENDYIFEYGLNESRQIMNYGGKFGDAQDAQFTKYYSENGDAEVIVNRATGQEKHLLYIGGTPYESSIVLLKDFAESTTKFAFLHKDYLGSILAISDEAGNAVEKRHFDAWGMFTHLQKGTATVITNAQQIAAASLLIDRGYTSHEHLAGVALIHMNGRLYDPLLRRFLNADENIQDPTNTQNYNKYGYVMNNPLMFSDPSGEFWVAGFFLTYIGPIIMGAIMGTAIAAGIYIIKSLVTGNWSWNGFARSLIIGAVTGGAGGGLLGMYSATSFNGAIVLGSMSGAIGGGVEAIFSGQNFFKGLYDGAVMGAATAGIGYTINYLVKYAGMQIEAKYYDGKGLENNSDAGNYSNETLNKIKNQLYGETQQANKYNVGSNNASSGGYGLTSDGFINIPVIDKATQIRSYQKAFAFTSRPNFFTGFSNIYYGPAAFSSKNLLMTTMAHETAHSYAMKAGNMFINYLHDKGIFGNSYGKTSLNTLGHAAIYGLENYFSAINGFPYNSSIGINSAILQLAIDNANSGNNIKEYNQLFQYLLPVFNIKIK